jgi:hypothetical protein
VFLCQYMSLVASQSDGKVADHTVYGTAGARLRSGGLNVSIIQMARLEDRDRRHSVARWALNVLQNSHVDCGQF